jgi:hypothetical protein
MANLATVAILEDGPGDAVIKLDYTIDTANLSEQIVADPATLMIDQGYSVKPNQLFIKKLKYSIQEPGALVLQWKATQNLIAWTCIQSEEMNFMNAAPIKNNTVGNPGSNGQLVATTTGWVSGTLVGSVLIYLGKGN